MAVKPTPALDTPTKPAARAGDLQGAEGGKKTAKGKGAKKKGVHSAAGSSNSTRPAAPIDVNYGADDPCPICMETMSEPRRLRCGHHLCRICLDQLRKFSEVQKSSCPTCRGPLPEVP